MDGHYKAIPLEEIEKTEDIPKFDHSIPWRRRQDKPPKIQIKTSPNKNCTSLHETVRAAETEKH